MTRKRIKKLYEKTYFERFRVLMRSFNPVYHRSCGCHAYISPFIKTLLSDKEMETPSFKHTYSTAYYSTPIARIAYNFRNEFLPQNNGLICKLTYGEPSKLVFDLINYRETVHEKHTIYEPEPGKIMTLNGVPLTFLVKRRKSNGSVGGKQVYNIRLYFQIDCSDISQLIEGYHLIAALRRNENYYFSRLPKEMIKLIQHYILE